MFRFRTACPSIFTIGLTLFGQSLPQDAAPKPSSFLAGTVPEAVPPTAKPATVLSLEMRGDIQMARKMFREAIDTYREAGTSAVLANKIGIAHHQMQQLDLARKEYERAVKMNPRYAEAVNNLGTIYYAKKSYRRAIGQYQRALRLAPRSASILSNLGTAYFARKKYEQAATLYQQAMAIDPEVFEHKNSQGILLQERSVEERAKFHFYLAKTYAQAGSNDRALLYIRKALEEGFKERSKFKEDPVFAALQSFPEFLELMALEPRVL